MAWLGVYRIIAKRGDTVYQLRHEETGKTEVVHEDRMKLTYNSQLSHKQGNDKAGKANDRLQDRYQL